MVYLGEYDAIQVYLGELEIQCIATPETRIFDRAEVTHENPASSHTHQVQTR